MPPYINARLQDFVDLLPGFAFKSHNFSEDIEDIALVKGENVSQGSILWGISKKWLASDWDKFEKYQLSSGDVILAMDRPWVPAGLKWAYIREGDPRALLVQRCCRLRSKSVELDQTFLRFIIASPAFEAYIKPITTGVNVPHISGAQILDFEFLLPPIDIQMKVAHMLAAYDDLIENNLRRMEVLEKISKNTYHEWFVNFRFPGSENISFKDSSLGQIPVSWDIDKLENHLSKLESGKRPKGGITEISSGIPSIGAESIEGIGKHNFVTEKLIPLEFFESMNKGVVEDGDVAIYKDGAYIGKSTYYRDGFPYEKCCVNEHVFLLRSNNDRLRQNALYLWLQERETVHAIRSTNANAAQPGINKQGINGLTLIIPDLSTSKKFDELIEPFIGEIINLAKQNSNLRHTRDLLLLKLLSSPISVGDLA